MSSNYSIWKSQIEGLLFYKDLYDPIEGDGAKSSDKTSQE